jgi:hypothetical protein
VGEAVLDGGASGGDDPVGGLLAGGEFAGAGGPVAGDDDRVVGVVVEAEEAQVGQGAEAGGAQVLDDEKGRAGRRRSRWGGPSRR